MRVIGEDDHGVVVGASAPSAIVSPLSPHAQDAALQEQGWEITKIVGKKTVWKEL